MKYVTFYWSIMGGVQHVEMFATEADALKNFRANYRRYFDYYCMSIRDFKKCFPNAAKVIRKASGKTQSL